MKLSMYSRGGSIYKKSDSSGLVFLEKDWNGGRLPRDLIEEFGLIENSLSILDSHHRARLAGYVRSGNSLQFEFSPNAFPKESDQHNKFYLASEINGWSNVIGNPEWLLKPDNHNPSVMKFNMDWNIATGIGEFPFKFVSNLGEWFEPLEFIPCAEKNKLGTKNFLFSPERSGKDILAFDIVTGPGNDNLEKWLSFSPTGKFGYSKSDKGAIFRVFAPRVKKVDLLLFSNQQEGQREIHPMSRMEDGSWVVNLPFCCEGKHYKYLVENTTNAGKEDSFFKEIIDPYSPATTSRDGTGIAITVEPAIPSSNFIPPPIEKLVILETHIRDLLAHAQLPLTNEQRLEFNGLTKWLQTEDCYLKRLGVNAIELQPVHDFDSRNKEEYHWGYMPVNLFAPASSYANNPNDGSVISEFKQLITTFHDQGLAVIVDVVYNHFGVPNYLSILDRELYLSTDGNGMLTNHSGCGNDINPHSGASRKLIIDSLKSMVENYSIDGFRFDLGELLGFELLSEIESELHKDFPHLILIAEPWSFRGRLPDDMSKTSYSLWSDQCREKLFSFVSGRGHETEIIELLKGRLDRQNQYPWQSVNYLESHDDYTFIDRLCTPEEWSDGSPPQEAINRAKLAIGLLLLSPGIPMLASGQDYLRSKNGVRNTYKRGDLNALNYDKLSLLEYIHIWTKDFITFRMSELGNLVSSKNFLSTDQYEIIRGNKNCFAFIVKKEGDKQTKKILLILVNGSEEQNRFEFPKHLKEFNLHQLLGDKSTTIGTIQAMSLQVWGTKI